jgi:phosphatidylethanolamine/phosphatidyl-N-methylethanolamine N-methyltransferase
LSQRPGNVSIIEDADACHICAGSMKVGMRAEIDEVGVKKAYARWAPVYDLVFGGPLFHRGRRAAVIAADRVGGTILEVGVGTGISLRDYSADNRIVGVDLSDQMLQKAKARVLELALGNVIQLEVMDAEHLAFPDDSFDAVVATYVVSTCPNPEAALDEFARVVKPGGEIVLANRVGAEAGMRRRIEETLRPIVCWLGWRLDFPWKRFADWVAQRTDIHLIERRPMPPFDHFSLLRFGKSLPQPQS